MSKAKDLTGQRFGRWTVVGKEGEYRQGSTWWYCDCDCGTKNAIVSGCNLNKGHSNSCGCYRKEFMSTQKKKYNTYNLTGKYGIGYTQKDEPFYFDLEDYDKIKEYCWFYSKSGYIESNETNKGENRKHVSMHRLVMNAKVDDCVDHIFHIIYDNRKSGLRITTQSQNSMNQVLRINNTSGVKGVSWDKNKNKWIMQICVRGNNIVKQFTNKEDTIKCRSNMDREYFGEYALKTIDN